MWGTDWAQTLFSFILFTSFVLDFLGYLFFVEGVERGGAEREREREREKEERKSKRQERERDHGASLGFPVFANTGIQRCAPVPVAVRSTPM